MIQVCGLRTTLPRSASRRAPPPALAGASRPGGPSRTISQIVAASAAAKSAAASMVGRQPSAPMTAASGARAPTAPTIAISMVRPESRAKRLGGNHRPASCIVPMKVAAEPIPTRKRPK